MAYPVTFDVSQQERYDRVQVVIRLLILIVLAMLGVALGWINALLYIGIPVLAAVLISQKGPERYLAESRDNMTLWLRYILALYAYIGLLTDRLPGTELREIITFDVAPEGEPTAGGVLLRIITAIPHAIVLGILGIVAGILLLIAGIMILIQESYPAGIFDFLRGYLRWVARLFAYLGGLVEEYPPFALDTGPEAAISPPAASPEEQA